MEEKPLIEKPPIPKNCKKKKNENDFKIREEVHLDYPLYWKLSKELRECELFLLKVVKNLSNGLV